MKRHDGTRQAGGPGSLTAWAHGQVQGVGFRWWTRSRAVELRLVGRATNLAGFVER